MAASISIIVSVVDGKNESSTIEFHIPSTTTLANIIAFGKAIAVLVDPLIGGQITRIGACLNVPLPAGLKATPQTLSDVEEGAMFNWRTVGGFPTKFRLPTFLEANIIAGTREVDLTDADVLALFNGMITGVDVTGQGGTGSVAPTDGRDDDILSLTSALELFQASRTS